MLQDSQEISKVSQNLSIRLSPERKYPPKCISCPTCFYYPCRCCSICHCLPCRCCVKCHCSPCKCYLHCSPIRCCSPCYSPCRIPRSCCPLSPICPSNIKPISPNRTNKTTYYSPSRVCPQNDYFCYEERQFNDFLVKLMNIEDQIECAKINLALNPDFNCEDAFRIFEFNGRGFLDENDLKYGLNLIGICPTDYQVRLLMKRFDLQKEGCINYADFFDMLVPFEKEYRTMIENRLPHSCCPYRCPDIFCFNTLCALRNVFNLIINTESEINNNRKLFGTLRLRLRDIFGLLDYLRTGYFTNSDLIVYLKNRGLFTTNKQADLLFIRLDKYRNGKIDFRNVEDELQTLY